ncbi:MAG: exopolyphosphatase [Nitrospirota bacterium]|nr:MAG: exopolyphosphatase [Nitrospirota bacterium]
MRLVTRGDLDGMTAAVLISEMEDIESIELVHPQDITSKKFEITDNDIMANLPYHPSCHMWFDHHQLTDSNEKPPADFKGKHALETSVARVIYDYYNSDKLKRFDSLISETDRFDAARLSMDDVTDPKGVILLGFTIDSRTGIGKFKDYFKNLVGWVSTMSIDEVLAQPEVADRIKIMQENNDLFLEKLKEHSSVDGNIVITDFRNVDKVPVGNRFLIYTLFPDANISVRLQWGPNKEFIATTLGHSIFNRTSNANCGEICSKYGGGGHKGAGAVPIKTENFDRDYRDLLDSIKAAD